MAVGTVHATIRGVRAEMRCNHAAVASSHAVKILVRRKAGPVIPRGVKLSRVIFRKRADRTAVRVIGGVVAGLLSVALAGCVSTGGADPALKAYAKQIGVVSLIDADDPPGGERSGFPGPEASGLGPHGADKLAGDAAGRELESERPGAHVTTLPGEAANVHWSTQGQRYVSPVLDNSRIAKACQAQAPGIAARHHLDLVVFLAPGWAYRSQGVVQAGCGFWARSAFGVIHSDLRIYVNYQVIVCDGKTGQRVGGSGSRIDDEVKPKIPWKRDAYAYSASDRELMAGSLTRLIDEDVPKRLHDAGLIP